MTGNNHASQGDDRRCGHCERQSGECAVRCRDCDGWLCGDCAGTETVECGCGNTVCDDCARTCNECGSRMCGDCAYYCEHCEHSLCEDCGYRCRMCDDRLCSDCQEYCEQCDERYCPYCYERHACANTQDPCYRDPYEGRPVREPFTFGLEIEVDGNHDTDMLRNHRLIAGWCPDGSLHHDGSLEYQSEPMTMSDLAEIRRLVERIATDTDNTLSGGHMHISRTGRQTPARWYWALEALDGTQCEALNMRHMTDTRWCELIHGDYCGKDTAINDTHRHTIEFRTFGPWHHDTAGRLDAAVRYMHAMWRFFQKFPVPKLKTRDIRAMSRVAATQAINDTNATTAGRRRI